jgi:hypothetical protein
MLVSARENRGGDGLMAGGALLMIVCCVAGPAALGAAAGSAIGGWLGIACAVLLACLAGLLIHRRRRGSEGC